MSHDFLFYLEHCAADSGELRLEGEEHHHLARVVRMRPGDTAFVTDGAGTMVECRVGAVEKTHTVLAPVRAIETAGKGRLPVLALGCIKKERFERAVAYGTELGFDRCIPFISHNSMRVRYTDQYLGRLRSIALSAMKQAFSAWLPEIAAPLPFDDLLDRFSQFDSVFVGERDAQPLSSVREGKRILVVAGPEAGFTPHELEQLKGAGATFVSVSSRRLRSETAAVAMLALVNSPRGARQSD